MMTYLRRPASQTSSTLGHARRAVAWLLLCAACTSESPGTQTNPADTNVAPTAVPTVAPAPSAPTDNPTSEPAEQQQELSCGTYERVDSEQRNDIPEYERNRDPEALAARQWGCFLEAGSTAATDDDGRRADALPPVEADAGVSDGGAPVTTSGDAGDVAAPAAPDFLSELGCLSDFERLASHTAAGISVKVLVDRAAPVEAGDDFPVYFINSTRYGIHYDFASDPAHLNVGPDNLLPPVGSLTEFNTTEYTSPSRRFLLGALTYYAGSDTWVYELAPNDTSTPSLILTAFDLVEKHTWIGSHVKLHTTSEAIAQAAQQLPEDIDAVPTSDLISSDYQALNLATSIGRLRFISSEELESQTKYVDFQDIVVLDHVPNDISVTLGIITDEFQTPLAHINVLSQNRGTPNMALRGAFDDPELRALEERWVSLEVRQDGYELEEVSQEVADQWWDEHKPSTVAIPNVDKETSELRNIEDLVNLEADSIYDAVKKATVTYGGKAAHFATLAHIEGLPVPKAFAIPVHYYFEFMQTHGFDAQVAAMLADPEFQASPEVRDVRLEELRDAMKEAPIDPQFMSELRAKLAADFPGQRMRFRSSTNAEDLDGFTGAGLYTSKSGDESGNNPDDAERTFDNAIRKVWASVWFFRAFEERRYRGIAHEDVGMALLVHRSFPDEHANGVALTNNPFDQSGAYPAFYVNVQRGEDSVVLPPAGITTDAYLHHWDTEGQRTQYLSYSNSPLVGPGQTVLTTGQIRELGDALAKIRKFFAPAYSRGTEWWAMDVEFKFDADPGQCPELFVKQARPFGNR